MNGLAWTAGDIQTLAALYPDNTAASVAKVLGRGIRSVYQKAASMRLKKSYAFFTSENAGRIQRGKQHPAMLATQFKPGQKVWNAGMKGWSAPGTEATRFKPGSTPPNRQEVGALRINSDGQLDIKLYEGLRSWVQLSHYSWWCEHGEWPPPGMVLRFRDGDTHNPAITNLQLITRQENMRLNSIHTNFPPEIVRLTLLRGALNRQINRHETKLAELQETQ